jgi:hypothetical protein
VIANNSASTSTTVSAAPTGHGGGGGGAWSPWGLAALTLLWFAHLRRRVGNVQLGYEVEIDRTRGSER